MAIVSIVFILLKFQHVKWSFYHNSLILIKIVSENSTWEKATNGKY